MLSAHELSPTINTILLNAKKLFDAQKYDEALLCYNEALTKETTNLEALTGRYKTYLKKGPSFEKQAKADLEAAVKLKQQENESKEKDVFITRYLESYKANQIKDQKTQLSHKVVDIRTAAEARHAAIIALKRNAFETAIGLNTQSLEVFANDRDAHFDRGIAHLKLKQFPAAITDFNFAIKIKSSDVAAYFSRAQAHLESKEINKAKLDLIEICKHDILRSINLHEFLLLYQKLNDWMTVEDGTYPIIPPILECVDGGFVDLAQKYILHDKDVTRGLQCYHRAVHWTLNYILKYEGPHKFQTTDVKLELKNLVSIMISLGNYYFHTKNYPIALFHFSLVTWLAHPSFFDIKYEQYDPVKVRTQIVLCHYMLGDLAIAKKYMIDLEDFYAALKKGNSIHKKALDSAVKIESVREKVYLTLSGKAHNELAQENYELAEEYFMEMIKFNGLKADVLVDLAVSQRQQNKLEEARKYLKQALKIDSTHERALINLNELKELSHSTFEEKKESASKTKSKKSKSGSHKLIKQGLPQVPKKKLLPPSPAMLESLKKEMEERKEAEKIYLEMQKEKLNQKIQAYRERNASKTEKRAQNRKDALHASIHLKKEAEKKQEEKKKPETTEIKSTAKIILLPLEKDADKKQEEKKRPETTEIKPTAKITLLPLEKYCLEKLQVDGAKTFLVGRLVRNKIIKAEMDPRADIDIVTSASEEMIRKAFPNVYQNPYDTNMFTTYENGIKVDIRRNPDLEKSLVADAKSRNFTICTLLADSEGNVYDPLNQGLTDLTHKDGVQLNTVTPAKDECFVQDPLRIIQALYLHVTTPTIISEKLMAEIKECIPLLTKTKDTKTNEPILNPNRLHSWMLKLLTHKPQETFEKMIEWGILQQLFPQIAPQLIAEKEWIIAELKALETRTLIRGYLTIGMELTRYDATQKTKFEEYSEQLASTPKITTNDVYSIFIMSELKQKSAHYIQFNNPAREVISSNNLLSKYYEDKGLSSRILGNLDQSWVAKHPERSPESFATVEESAIHNSMLSLYQSLGLFNTPEPQTFSKPESTARDTSTKKR